MLFLVQTASRIIFLLLIKNSSFLAKKYNVNNFITNLLTYSESSKKVRQR